MSYPIKQIHIKDLECILGLCKVSCIKILKEIRKVNAITNRTWITPKELSVFMKLDVAEIKDSLDSKPIKGAIHLACSVLFVF